MAWLLAPLVIAASVGATACDSAAPGAAPASTAPSSTAAGFHDSRIEACQVLTLDDAKTLFGSENTVRALPGQEDKDEASHGLTACEYREVDRGWRMTVAIATPTSEPGIDDVREIYDTVADARCAEQVTGLGEQACWAPAGALVVYVEHLYVFLSSNAGGGPGGTPTLDAARKLAAVVLPRI